VSSIHHFVSNRARFVCAHNFDMLIDFRNFWCITHTLQDICNMEKYNKKQRTENVNYVFRCSLLTIHNHDATAAV